MRGLINKKICFLENSNNLDKTLERFMKTEKKGRDLVFYLNTSDFAFQTRFTFIHINVLPAYIHVPSYRPTCLPTYKHTYNVCMQCLKKLEDGIRSP